MKKAKIILTVIAMLAIVGGALAFKVKRGSPPAYIPNGETVTSTVIGGFVYITTVPFAMADPMNFISTAGILENTFKTTLTRITGFAPNGNTRTWMEVICTSTATRITTVP